jgi:hypothetical protein
MLWLTHAPHTAPCARTDARISRVSANGTLYAHCPAATSWFDMDLEKKLQAEEDAKKEAEAKRLQVSEWLQGRKRTHVYHPILNTVLFKIIVKIISTTPYNPYLESYRMAFDFLH